MDENVEPTVESVLVSEAQASKKKTRRGNKGRPKPKEPPASEENLDAVDSLTEAARKLMISQEEVLQTAFGLQANPSTSHSGVEERKPRKKVADFLIEQSLARAAGLPDLQFFNCDSQTVTQVSKNQAVLKEKVVIEQGDSPVTTSQRKNTKKKSADENKTTVAEPQVKNETSDEGPKKKSRSKKKTKKAAKSDGDNLANNVQLIQEEQNHCDKRSDQIPELQKQSDSSSTQTHVDSVLPDPEGLIASSETSGKKKRPHKKKAAKAAARAALGETVEASGSAPSLLQGTVSETKDKSLPGTPKRKDSATPVSKGKREGPGTSQKRDTATPETPKKKESVTPSSHKKNEEDTPGSARKRPPRKSRGSSDMDDNSFPPHWSYEQVTKCLTDNTLIKGTIRINKKNFREAYITSPDGGMDIMLEGIQARNRSLEGDEVAVQVLTPDKWKGKNSNEKQRTGEVVHILQKVHHRQAIGTIKPLQEANSVWALFSPKDSRVPRIRVMAALCPPNFGQMPEMLYLAQINEWNDLRFALGTLQQVIGMGGSVETETVSILAENGLDVEPYGPEMSNYFPSMPYTIPQAEIKKREDMRKLCIFTIDPATARDLDDAVSYQELPNGQGAEVGVHISDVAFFLKENTPLDATVSSRATTTYLVQSVFHMLPVELCRLCSLTPGEDKLAFSVLWRVTPKGEFLEPRFTRSVIHSCTQMSYENAQAIMDAPPGKVWGPEELPKIHGGFTPADVVQTVLGLRPLALALRGKRFDGGALRIDQPKLCFSLDSETGLPKEFFVYTNQECHRLIEELMLLANTAVARYLHQHQPDIALLRSHPAPHDHMLPELQSVLAKNGVHLDISSSGAIHTTLQQYLGSDDPNEVARGWAISALLSKPMARARYFCAQGTDKDEQWHYALSVPLYTHFTSPIRRYADVMVHRLLAAILDYSPLPDWHPDYVNKVASNCNGKKYSAKRAGEQSGELYLTLYVGMHGPLREEAVVIDVKDHSFDVLVLRTGSNHRVYTNNLNGKIGKAVHKQVFKNVWESHIEWKQPALGLQIIKLFSIVTVELNKAEKDLRIDAKICPPSS